MLRSKSRQEETVDRQSTIKTHRLRKGWTQDELGRKVGLRRQAVYDMEAGRYLPNTAVSLALARLFGCAVEELFPSLSPDARETVRIFGDPATDGTRLVLGRVRETLVGLPADDARFTPLGLSLADAFTRSARNECLSPEIVTPRSVLDKTLLIAGCNPALAALDAHIRRVMPSARARCVFASSASALRLVAEGGAHAASVHFHTHGHGPGQDQDGANVTAAREAMGGMPCRVLRFAVNEEGLMVAGGNPLGIRTVADLARPGARFVNREKGAALRKLLDDQLAQGRIPVSAVPGYASEVRSHAEGAFQIVRGVADAALGLSVVAGNYGLGFVPLAATHCDLVIPEDVIDFPPMAALLEALHTPLLRREMACLPGFDASGAGKEIARV